jgi:hypothetical protein
MLKNYCFNQLASVLKIFHKIIFKKSCESKISGYLCTRLER